MTIFVLHHLNLKKKKTHDYITWLHEKLQRLEVSQLIWKQIWPHNQRKIRQNIDPGPLFCGKSCNTPSSNRSGNQNYVWPIQDIWIDIYNFSLFMHAKNMKAWTSVFKCWSWYYLISCTFQIHIQRCLASMVAKRTYILRSSERGIIKFHAFMIFLYNEVVAVDDYYFP